MKTKMYQQYYYRIVECTKNNEMEEICHPLIYEKENTTISTTYKNTHKHLRHSMFLQIETTVNTKSEPYRLYTTHNQINHNAPINRYCCSLCVNETLYKRKQANPLSKQPKSHIHSKTGYKLRMIRWHSVCYLNTSS